MTKKRRFRWLEFILFVSVVSFLVQLIPDIWHIWQEWPRAGRQTPGTFWHRAAKGGWIETKYWVYLPENYSDHSEWPLLLYLHGGGDRGNDLEKSKRRGMANFIDQGKKFPMIVVSPQCPNDFAWESVPLMELLDDMEKRFSVDRQRFYVMGFSMGGHGTWNLASRKTERFAGIVPIAGRGDPEEAKKLTDLPVWAFHGQRDSVVPVEGTTKMVGAIKAAGGTKVKMTVIPQEKHGIENRILKRNDLFEWLLLQKRVEKNG
jgi:predicted peptidase